MGDRHRSSLRRPRPIGRRPRTPASALGGGRSQWEGAGTLAPLSRQKGFGAQRRAGPERGTARRRRGAERPCARHGPRPRPGRGPAPRAARHLSYGYGGRRGGAGGAAGRRLPAPPHRLGLRGARGRLPPRRRPPALRHAAALPPRPRAAPPRAGPPAGNPRDGGGSGGRQRGAAAVPPGVARAAGRGRTARCPRETAGGSGPPPSRPGPALAPGPAGHRRSGSRRRGRLPPARAAARGCPRRPGPGLPPRCVPLPRAEEALSRR